MEQELTNYHTHTQLCKHAKGMPLDYLKVAEENNFTELGFSDHCPYPAKDEDCWHHCRMSLEEALIYKAEIEKCRQISRIPIRFGFECEWDKNYESWYRDELLGKLNADYLVLGAHWHTKDGHHDYLDFFNNKAALHEYIDQSIEGLKTGLYKFYAHPDIFMMNVINWSEDVKACSIALIDACIDLNIPMEVNGYGICKPKMNTTNGERNCYPYDEFWNLAKEKNVQIICNADAHKPKHLIENLNLAHEFSERIGLNIKNKLDF